MLAAQIMRINRTRPLACRGRNNGIQKRDAPPSLKTGMDNSFAVSYVAFLSFSLHRSGCCSRDYFDSCCSCGGLLCNEEQKVSQS